MTPALRQFIDAVIVPALVDRFVAETTAAASSPSCDGPVSPGARVGKSARGHHSNEVTTAGTAMSAPGGDRS